MVKKILLGKNNPNIGVMLDTYEISIGICYNIFMDSNRLLTINLLVIHLFIAWWGKDTEE